MNQCLRCHEPCGEDTEFCENCRAHLQERIHQSIIISNVSNSEEAIDTIPEATNNPIQVAEQDIANSHQNSSAVPNDDVTFSPKTSTLALEETKKIILTKFEEIDEHGILTK